MELTNYPDSPHEQHTDESATDNSKRCPTNKETDSSIRAQNVWMNSVFLFQFGHHLELSVADPPVFVCGLSGQLVSTPPCNRPISGTELSLGAAEEEKSLSYTYLYLCNIMYIYVSVFLYISVLCILFMSSSFRVEIFGGCSQYKHTNIQTYKHTNIQT